MPLKKELKLSKKNAETEMAWVILQWGLTIPSTEYTKAETKLQSSHKNS